MKNDLFRDDDTAEFLTLAAGEGWITDQWELDVLRATLPQGCLVRRIGTIPVAFITALRYDRSGWIGNLLVSQEQRRTAKTVNFGIVYGMSSYGLAKDLDVPVPLAQDFFQQLAATNRTVHVMVHSMGHQVALRALSQMTPAQDSPFIGELILNAPDIPL